MCYNFAMRRAFLSLLIFFLLLFLPFSPVFAWNIPRFDSDISVLETGKVQIEETITADFENEQKHGIFRDIPVTYSGKTQNDYVYTTVDVYDVFLDNENVAYEVIPSGAYIRIKIGDANRTISGVHTYAIHYTITGIVQSFDDHDELYINVTGNNWDVPITKAVATISLPKESLTGADCYEGSTGSTNPCSFTIESSTSAHFETKSMLSPGSGLTTVIGFTKGMVPILTIAAPQYPLKKEGSNELDFFSPINILSFFIPIVIIFLFIFSRWKKSGRDLWYNMVHPFDANAKEEVMPLRAHETIVVEFDPPEKLRPAEIGVLMDERADTLDVTATIVDLAGRGYLTIKELKKKWMFGSVDYEFTKVKDEEKSDLLHYEKALLNRLFGTKTVVTMSGLKTKFYTDLKEVKKLLYKDGEEKKLFAANPETVRGNYAGIGVVVIVLGGILLFFGGFMLAFLMFASVGVIIGGIIILAFSSFMPRRTAYGRQLYVRAKGYELFLTSAEKYKQQFFERKNMFNEILPYTIVFGVTEKFAQAFKDLGMKPPSPTWYYGTTHFNVNTFSKNMVTFSHAVSSSIQAAPRSSGFRSSGGFSGGSSGGGFGGGGGGSW